MKMSSPEYLEQAKKLSAEEQERLLSRMAGKLPRRLQKDKLSKEEALAIQLEIEDEQLHEWRARMHAIKAKSKAEAEPKAKAKSSKNVDEAVPAAVKAAVKKAVAEKQEVVTPAVPKAEAPAKKPAGKKKTLS
jgi:polyhydroxyalkanoate synthesis regulator protein